MSARVRGYGRFLVIALVLAGVCRPGQSQGAQELSLVRLVAEGNRANRERIGTWVGKAKVSVMTDYPNSDKYAGGASVTFAFDRQRKAKRWNLQTEQMEWVVAGERKIASELPFKNGLVKEGLYYNLGEYTAADTGVRQAHIQDETKTRLANESNDFDPFYYLSFSGNNPYDILMGWVAAAEQNPSFGMEVSREGDIVKLVHKSERTIATYEFDLAKGCNMLSHHVESRLDSKVSVMDWVCEYEEVGSAWVPRSYTSTVLETDDTKPGVVVSSRRREVVFADTVVNVPISESEFTLDAIGLRPNDVVRDLRTGVEYVYKGTSLRASALRSEELESLGDAALETEARSDSGEAGPSGRQIPEQPGASGGDGAAQQGRWEVFAVLGAAICLVIVVVVFKSLRRRGRSK